MKLEDILEDAFLVKPDESLTHVAFRMAEEKRCEAFVFDKELKGIITLDDLVKRRFSEPQRVKVSYFVRPVKSFTADAPIEDVIDYMLVSEYGSVPVRKDGKIFAVTKAKLLRFVKENVFEEKKAKDVMHFPYCADVNDTLSTVISIMKEMGMDSIPILDKNGRFVGLVDGVSLAEVLVDEHTSKRGEMFGDRARLEEIGIEMFVRTDVLRVEPETDLREIVRSIYESEGCAVVVEKGGEFAGMITVKDIFKLIGKKLETVYIRVTGLEEEDEFIKSKVDEMIENTVKKLLKSLTVNYVTIHVETHKKEGRRRKYSVQGRFVTNRGNFYATDYEWDPTKAMKLFLAKIEREVHKRIEKERGY